MLSSVNNALFLSSFSYFKHGFSIISKLRKRKYWFLIVLSISIPIVIYCLFAEPGSAGHPGGAEIIDLLFSSGTLLFMGLLLALAFHNRELSGLAVLALLVIVLEVVAQILTSLDLFQSGNSNIDTWKYVIYLVAHSLLLANFIALAFTWVIEDEGLLNKFDLHAKSQYLINEGIEVNISPFLDVQYRLISEHADLVTVCDNLKTFFDETKQDKKAKEIVQHRFRLAHSQNLFNIGLIDTQEFTQERLKVNALLIQLLKDIKD